MWLRLIDQSLSKTRDKNPKNCEIARHFAKVCRKSKIPLKTKPRVNNVDDTSSEVATVGTSATVGEKKQIETLIQRHSFQDANYDFDYEDFNDNCVAIISNRDNIREVKPVNMHVHFGNIETKALVDSGYVFTIIYKSLANAVVLNCQESYWVQSPDNLEL